MSSLIALLASTNLFFGSDTDIFSDYAPDARYVSISTTMKCDKYLVKLDYITDSNAPDRVTSVNVNGIEATPADIDAINKSGNKHRIVKFRLVHCPMNGDPSPYATGILEYSLGSTALTLIPLVFSGSGQVVKIDWLSD